MKLRLLTKFLLSMLLITAGLTWTSLLLVRRTVQAQVKKSIFADLHNSSQHVSELLPRTRAYADPPCGIARRPP